MNLKRYYFLLLTGIFCLNTATAQPRLTNQGVIGGNQYDVFASLYLTKDGGMIAGGTSNSDSSDQKTEDKRGDEDYWIVKIDSAGNKQWDKTLGGIARDELAAVQQTADGGYIVGGYSLSNASGEKTENRKGALDYWIVKLDSAGNIEWDKTIGGGASDYLTALQQTSDGGYILGGYSSSGISGDKTERSRGTDDYWVVKLNALGVVEWDKTIGGSDLDHPLALQQTAEGGYIVGGFSKSGMSGEKTAPSKGNNDYWIVKLNATGSIEWDKTIGSSGDDRLSALQQTSDGGYILGGYSFAYKSGDKSEDAKGFFDYWIVKLDVSLNKEWDRTIGGSQWDQLASLQQTGDGGYILGGYSFSDSSGNKTENSRGNKDYWVVKTNARGRVQWDKTIGASGSEDNCIVRELKKNVYVTGGTSYSGVSGDKTGPNRTNNGEKGDYWIVKLRYTKPAAIAEVQNNSKPKVIPQINASTFTVAPNPARDKLTIRATGRATFTLTNAQGKRLLAQTINNIGIMNVSKLPAGTYFLSNTITSSTQQIVISR